MQKIKNQSVDLTDNLDWIVMICNGKALVFNAENYSDLFRKQVDGRDTLEILKEKKSVATEFQGVEVYFKYIEKNEITNKIFYKMMLKAVYY